MRLFVSFKKMLIVWRVFLARVILEHIIQASWGQVVTLRFVYQFIPSPVLLCKCPLTICGFHITTITTYGTKVQARSLGWKLGTYCAVIMAAGGLEVEGKNLIHYDKSTFFLIPTFDLSYCNEFPNIPYSNFERPKSL